MIGYTVTIFVENSKNKYFETQHFNSKKEALEYAIPRNIASNVKKIILRKIQFTILEDELIKSEEVKYGKN